MAKPNYKFVLVEWMDAHQTLEELTFEEVKKQHKPAVVHTHGYLLVDDDSGMWIASEWLPGDPETFRQHTFVPRGMVKKVTYRGQRKPKSVPDSSKEGGLTNVQAS